MTIASAALLLFLILDPLGNIPVFLSLLRGLPQRRQRIVLAREMLIALAVLMMFLWGGKYALELMHLRQESVSIAGGIVLFLIGIRMIFPPPEGLMGELPDGEYRVMVMIPDGFYRTNDDSFNLTVLGEQPMQEVHFGVARD